MKTYDISVENGNVKRYTHRIDAISVEVTDQTHATVQVFDEYEMPEADGVTVTEV